MPCIRPCSNNVGKRQDAQQRGEFVSYLRVIKVIRLNGPPIPTISHPYSVLQIFDDGGVVIDSFAINRLPQLLSVEGAVAAGILSRFDRLEMLLIEFRVEFAEGGESSALRRHLRNPTGSAGIWGAVTAGDSKGVILEIGVTANPTSLRNVRRRHVRIGRWSRRSDI